MKTGGNGAVPGTEAGQRPGAGAAPLLGRGIRAGYDQDDVLHGIGFELHAGEVLGVVGPNGCGKSTLLRAVTGMLPLRGGETMIYGRSVSELRARQRGRLCAVQPQIEAPPFDYSVGEFVLLGRHPHRGPLSPATPEDRAAAERALRDTDLVPLAARSIRSLSTGEWQRALLARALAQDAPILLLDEPAAHLDPGHRFAVHILLRRLARERQRAVLCVSHDLNLAAEFCDRLMILSAGRVHALGKPEDVLTEDNLQVVFRCDAIRVANNPFTGQPGTVFAP